MDLLNQAKDKISGVADKAATASKGGIINKIARVTSLVDDELIAKREAALKPRVLGDFIRKYDRSPLPRADIAINVLAGIITSSPGFIPSDHRAIWLPSVPELVPRQYLTW